MNKNILIKNELYDKLKSLAEPFKDTPSSVIERIMDFYEKHHKSKVNEEKYHLHHDSDLYKPSTANKQNVYLAPASNENIKSTIRKAVSLNDVKRYFSEVEFLKISKALNGRTEFNCWAMTKAKKSIYNSMQKGDDVFLTIKNTGRFNYWGRILYKFYNKNMGDYIWGVVPGDPWEYIYLLENIKAININKEALVKSFGFKSNYAVYGLVKIKPNRMEKALNIYGSIESMVEKMNKKY